MRTSGLTAQYIDVAFSTGGGYGEEGRNAAGARQAKATALPAANPRDLTQHHPSIMHIPPQPIAGLPL